MRGKQETSRQLPYYHVRQVATRWQVSERKVYRLVKRGELVAHHFGSQLRISEADLNTFERVHRGD